jgi:hypothetical protein
MSASESSSLVRNELRITHCSLANLITANAKFLYPTILERFEAKCTEKAEKTTSIDQQDTLSIIVTTSAAEGGDSVFTANLAIKCTWRADKVHVVMRGSGKSDRRGSSVFLAA